MFNPAILLMVGGKRHGAAPGGDPVDPDPLEPYRVIWNPDVQANSPELYTHVGVPGKTAIVDAYAVLTDHAPQPKLPAMELYNTDPMQDLTVGSELYVRSDAEGNPPIRVNDIAAIAYPRRNGKLPKIISARLNTNADFTSLDLLRYNLTADGARYFSVRATTSPDSVDFQLFFDFGAGENSGPIYSVVGWDFDTMIRLVVYPNKLDLRHSEPGTLVSTLSFAGMPKPEEGAYLGLYQTNGVPVFGPSTLGIKSLIIYDGTF